MKVITIEKDNIDCIMDINKVYENRDNEFINALWQYVLYSNHVSRILPVCEICDRFEFVFEGFGGIKKVGNGLMYIPVSEEEIYVIKDITFHYFYIHNKVPTQKFRNAVIYGPKPESDQYSKIVETFYKSNIEDKVIWEHKKCMYCKKPFVGTFAFRKGSKRKNISNYEENCLDKILPRKYIGICLHCLHYTKV